MNVICNTDTGKVPLPSGEAVPDRGHQPGGRSARI